VIGMKLHVILEKQEEGGFTTYIPELPGCISQGDTREEALRNIKEARELYLEEITKEELKRLLANVRIIPAVVK
jgi:predicted RNase H-like HicB family nuclease